MKGLLFFPLLLGLAAAPAWTQPNVDLARYQWKNRLLLIFAPSEADPAYQGLKRQLNDLQKELTDRDLLVFHCFEQGPGTLNGRTLPQESVARLRERFEVQPGRPTLILIGKDGGEKGRQVGSFDLQAFFRRIDAMPMRQREMRRKQRE